MTSDEFYAEWPRCALRWNKDPDSKFYKKVAYAWSVELKQITVAQLRQAINRLSAQEPDRFPTIGTVKREISTMNAWMNREATEREVRDDSPATIAEYRAWAEELRVLGDATPHGNVAAFYAELAEHWRQSAERVAEGVRPAKPLISEMVKRHGIGWTRPLPAPALDDFDSDGRDY